MKCFVYMARKKDENPKCKPLKDFCVLFLNKKIKIAQTKIESEIIHKKYRKIQ